MRHFFIDLENVRSAGLDGVTSLTSEDRVYVFYSDNANTLTIPTLESIGNSDAKVQYLKITRTGSNAMDFQIVSLYSALIEREKKGSFFIISHDNGFKSAISFCEHYFTEYDLVLASFSSIRAALENRNGAGQKSRNAVGDAETSTKNSAKTKDNTGKKNSAKSGKNGSAKKEKAAAKNDSVKAEETPENSSVQEDKSNEKPQEEAPAKTGRSRRRRRGRGGRELENTENTVNGDEQTEALEAAAEKTEPVEENAQETAANTEKKSRRSRRRGRGRNKSENADKSESVNESQEEAREAARSKPEKTKQTGSKQYIYDILADYASKNLLDVYVNLIDEGVRKSKNKDALKNFFGEKCEAQEAEALYSLVKIEFDALRKAKK